MIANTLSAANWYADAAILGVLALFLLAGIIRGFRKSLKGFFVSIFIVLLSLLFMGLTHSSVMKSELGGKLENSLEKSSDGWGTAFNSPIQIAEDGSMTIIVDGNPAAIDSVDGIKGKIAKWCAEKFVTETGQTAASAIMYSITSLIVAIIMFVVFVIALSVLFALIRHFTAGMSNSDLIAVKAVDKTLGAVISLVFGVVFVSLVLAILAALEDKLPQVDEYLRNSPVSKLFYENNPIAIVFRKIFVK